MAVERILKRFAKPGGRANDFNLKSTRPIGGGRDFDSWRGPFYCSPDPIDGGVYDSQIVEHFGWIPDSVNFALGAYCNGDAERQALADLAAHLAEETGGVIDFGTRLKEAEELPGRTAVLFYKLTPPQHATTYLDSEAMRAWARRSDCWMLK